MKKILLLLIIFLPSLSDAQLELKGFGKLTPVDESSMDKSFSEFYAALKTAIANRDAPKVESIIWQQIRMNEYEPEKNGKNYFMAAYNLSDSANEFWVIANKIMKLGVVKERRSPDASFMAPSIWYTEEYSKIFGEEYYMDYTQNENLGSAVGDNVLVYTHESELSQLRGKLNQEIVKIKNFNYDKRVPWFEIELKDESKGFVKSENIYLAMFDYLMGFKRFNDTWYINFFQRTGV